MIYIMMNVGNIYLLSYAASDAWQAEVMTHGWSLVHLMANHLFDSSSRQAAMKVKKLFEDETGMNAWMNQDI